jgi:GT2 family glycosyltransferase
MDFISVVSVNFNQPEATKAFLLSLKNYCSLKLEIIIVDNASDINSEDEFKEIVPELLFIRSKTNIGFAGGNNLGITQAKGDYILLLNNDTEIVKGSIETLVSELKNDKNIGLLSPLILYHDDQTIIQYAGFTPLNYLTARNKQLGLCEKNTGQYNGLSYQTGFCHGAAVICRKTDLLKAGLMDESYFLYYEELDWCEKFKRIGKTINFTGKTHIYHKESISVGKDSPIKIYFMTRNRMLFIRKNTGLFNNILFSLYYTFIACPKLMLTLAKNGNLNKVKYVLKGLLWNFTNSKNTTNLGFKI